MYDKKSLTELCVFLDNYLWRLHDFFLAAFLLPNINKEN